MSISKAFYKSNAPKLLHSFVSSCSSRQVQLWTTSCIVTQFGQSFQCQADLVNPSNPELSGCRHFPYFPRGGPVPEPVTSMHKDWQPLGYVSQWGGMEVGAGMLYRVSVIDGLVHQQAGWKLAAELHLRRAVHSQPCPVGTAVRTTAGDLAYRSILHTTPPFFRDSDSEKKLLQCYESVLALTENKCLCLPLIGSGARGFPYDSAIRVAAKAVQGWMRGDDDAIVKHFDERKAKATFCWGDTKTVAFGILEESHAHQLAEAMVVQLEGAAKQ